ncbi:MAG TPA: circadian clock protein KaiC [Gammaproteobacteria bacterium]|nr:circadian clock protein KaiC [Gammaproteobacteria bacterium]
MSVTELRPKPKSRKKRKSRPTAKSGPTSKSRPQLPKTPTGIQGLDEITYGGLPKGRPTLVCGGTGCGKTLLAMEFLVKGATEFNEPGVFMAFEESAEELTENVASLGFDLNDLVTHKKLLLDFVYIEHNEFAESGEYDLEGLFIRLGSAIDSIGAKRVVLDTIEVLFACLPDTVILRAELRRLFRWLKDKGVTAIITGEHGGKEGLTRQGLEEYVSDSVIMLDHRVNEQTSSRRLRVVKYRGSIHGTNEYPFLIDDNGITVMPVTSLTLDHKASGEHISSGVARLDSMLGGKGYYHSSSVLISGTAGTGKSSLAAHFADAACGRGERVLYFSFEESPEQIVRNMKSIGINLQQWIKKSLLQIHSNRPSYAGLEMHLVVIHKLITDFKPHVVIIDPLNSFVFGDNVNQVKSMLIRLIDLLKTQQITGLFTNLSGGGATPEQTEVEVSSLIDTWLLVRDIDEGGERNRGLSILKSRGMAHSNQIREFLLTEHGVELRDVYVGPEGVLTGSARLTQESENEAAMIMHDQEVELRRNELERKRTKLEAQIDMLRAEFALQEIESMKIIGQEKAEDAQLKQDRVDMGESRKADSKPNKCKGNSK